MTPGGLDAEEQIQRTSDHRDQVVVDLWNDRQPLLGGSEYEARLNE
jgi:hypothetical protein